MASSGMTVKVSAEGLDAAIVSILQEFGDNVDTITEWAVDETAKESVKTLKAKSPKRTGAYAKGWRQKRKNAARSGNYTRIIHNATRYRITAPLEFGHVIATRVKGVKVYPRGSSAKTREFEHIRPVREDAEKMVVQKIKEAIGQI